MTVKISLHSAVRGFSLPKMDFVNDLLSRTHNLLLAYTHTHNSAVTIEARGGKRLMSQAVGSRL